MYFGRFAHSTTAAAVLQGSVVGIRTLGREHSIATLAASGKKMSLSG
jgi:hypothetical protein